MPITDNRTQLQASDDDNDVSADTDAAPTSLSTVTGTFIQGSNSNAFQMDDAQEVFLFDQDTTSSTFNIDLSDSTVYILIKFGTPETFANLGGLLCLGDTASAGDIIGYAVTGADVAGFPYEFGFAVIKLDVSVVVATPGTNDVDYYQYSGTEAGLNHAAILQVGFGSFSLVKAVSTSANSWCDGVYYIANGSYAATIDGGTVGAPETMGDIAGDDVALGAGLINNPKGSEYGFFSPTQWGTPSGTADSYFTATGEQWYWIGDNAGGHAVGATHFPFRLIGNATGTNSFVATNVVIVSTGTASEYDASDTNMDIVEFDNCLMDGLASFETPASGGTSRFCNNSSFVNCGLVTHNGCSMTGSSMLTSTVAADEGAIFDDRTTSASTDLTEYSNMTFRKGTNSHHAMRFGANVTHDITLTGLDFTGFGSTGDATDAVFRFDAISGTLNLNLVGCTTDGTFSVDDAAGVTVTVVIDPVTELVNVKDTSDPAVNLSGARVMLETAEIQASGEMYEAATDSITSTGTTGTVTTSAVHGLVTGDKVVIRGAQPDEYNKVATVTVTSTTVFTYTTTSGISSPATGTPIVSFVAVHGTTNGSGDISATRTWTAVQAMKGVARLKTSVSPFYKDGNIAYDIDITNGNTINVVLQPDE